MFLRNLGLFIYLRAQKLRGVPFLFFFMSAEIIRWVLENLDYWVVVLFMAIESSFIPFPSEVVVPPAAWLSMASDSMNIVLVVVAATIGADVGALVNYALARYLGRPIVYRFADSRLGHLCLLDRAKVEHAEDYFRRHGATSTFFGRLVPAVRQLISIPAGLAKMPIGKFLVFTTLGAGVWNTILALIGWGIYRFTSVKTVDEVYQLAKQYNAEISIAVLVIVAIAIGVVVYKARKK